MIAVDTNIVVYAHREDLPQYKRALRWLTALAEGKEPWALPVLSFLRVPGFWIGSQKEKRNFVGKPSFIGGS